MFREGSPIGGKFLGDGVSKNMIDSRYLNEDEDRKQVAQEGRVVAMRLARELKDINPGQTNAEYRVALLSKADELDEESLSRPVSRYTGVLTVASSMLRDLYRGQNIESSPGYKKE
ncbi:MAG: hypothetical protein WCG48_01065 [Candidatus Berkelbacteria bacterium]